jgi:hypothetical protein
LEKEPGKAKVQNTFKYWGVGQETSNFVVSFTVNGNLLLGQVVFIGTTHRCLPPSIEGKQKCINSSWHFTFSENHWSTLETTKDFVRKVLLAYLHKQIQQFNLQENQKLVWLINSYSIHKSKEFFY